MISESDRIAQLQAELEEARKLRDQWCDEYRQLRDEMRERILKVEDLVEQIAFGMGIRT